MPSIHTVKRKAALFVRAIVATFCRHDVMSFQLRTGENVPPDGHYKCDNCGSFFTDSSRHKYTSAYSVMRYQTSREEIARIKGGRGRWWRNRVWDPYE